MQEGQVGEEHIPILGIVVVYEQETVGLATASLLRVAGGCQAIGAASCWL